MRTLSEAKDYVLQMAGALGSTKYATIVLQLLNDALLFVSGSYDWEFLRGFTTFSTSDATGIVKLPVDMDRVLAMHQEGKLEILTKLDPLDFEIQTEDTEAENPAYWTVYGWARDTSTGIPSMQIQIHPAPAKSTTYRLWYIKRIDDITSEGDDYRPNVPPHIWDLAIHKAILELQKLSGASATVIRIAEKHFIDTLALYTSRETLGTSRYFSIDLPEEVKAYRKGRLG